MPRAGSLVYRTRVLGVRLIVASCVAFPSTFACSLVQAEERVTAPADADIVAVPAKLPSPWLFAPVFNSSPKLGITLGAIAGYLTKFDADSRASIFAMTGQYTNTDSIVGGAFARTSFNQDHDRLNAGMAYGNIKNDYNDYLGTGVALRNNAELRSFIARYLRRVYGDWFVGAQGLYQNFGIAGATEFDDLLLDILGIAPYKSGGLGLVGYFDSRDNDFKPSLGSVLSVSNIAYRQALGGDNDFDVYRLDLRHFVPLGGGSVFALRQLNHLTDGAPTQNLAPVQLRGYKVGQYAGKFMSQLEGEARLQLRERWTATVFAGVACTYGAGRNCSESANLFPAIGAGVQFVLKPAVGIVLNLEYAQGKDGNYGIYLKTGYAF